MLPESNSFLLQAILLDVSLFPSIPSKAERLLPGSVSLKENFGPPAEASEEIPEVTPVMAPGIHMNAADPPESVLLISRP